ncbi:hypothetical protein [Phaeodactylibacter sp.]|uniref:hypothetical protein n=1 Tax=Phaeodactylibacter sp. TaxID=1940289 RepID=UPI0025F63E24|nr:hypothetical protein [Phaeodactylibacter sp.]MCI4650824.1 hypothetical protein [Phaeodactylibacter sp.]MCI5089781.1 hypothetical protein [Phaeodactylibacter sp.]
MSKKTKKRPMRQRMRQEVNNIGRDFAIGILVLCFIAFLMSCSRSTAITTPDFYAMPALGPSETSVPALKANSECDRHGDVTHKGTQTCLFCEKPVRDEN